MARQFNSEHRKQQLLSETMTLTLERIMNEKRHSTVSESLDELVARINRNVTQLPDGFNTEKHKDNFLREAVISYGWCDVAILQSQSGRISFPRFVGTLNLGPTTACKT